MTIRTRFAPSPTGYLHIGGVRTALFNWLLARRHGGQFVLRIDDTDRERHVDHAVEKILDGFRWIGIDWDEGPEVGGSNGPYYQSQRTDHYRQAAQRLVDSGNVYRDYSTDAERAAEKLAAERDKRAYRFRGKPLPAADLARFEAEGRPYALRFQVPLGRTLVVHDQIKGDVSFVTDDIGDFVIVRPDGAPLYNFASVVDDLEMRITHVVRAEEHLSNTFPQLLIFEALGATPPVMAHIPYVAEPGSRAKMSKRKIAEYEKLGVLVYLHQYIERGYLPEAVMNYLSRLGWSYDDSQEIFTPREMIEKFSLDRVNSSPASHDQDKLFWVQGEWMKMIPLERKVAGVVPFLAGEGLISSEPTPDQRARIEAVVRALGDRLKTYSDILKLGRFFFSDGIVHDPDAVKKRLRKDGVAVMLGELETLVVETSPFDLATLERSVHDFAERTGRKMGDVVNPLRVAVTGQGVGPGLYDCLVILGRETCLARIQQTRAMLATQV